ncbi:antitoxin [Catenulispora pinisilvae]|uniref:antitoxin n=1 Tax=Catenulispora pinisilvae TaxID=2705253 RepID=UPI001891BB85|nr:antitoxin [Catenulispora pinisilvae]
MSILDKIKGLLKGHEDQAHKGIEKAGDVFDSKTGNKYQGQVDTVQKKLADQVGNRPPTDERR